MADVDIAEWKQLNYYRLKPVDLASAGSRLKIILGFEVTVRGF